MRSSTLWRLRALALTPVLITTFLFGPLPLARAGCGCDKPPPALAEVRPNATYAGTDVTLFHSTLQSGQAYDVTFTSGITGESVTIQAQAVTRRDLADSQDKPQLVVSVPVLPLGPTSLSVRAAGQSGALLAVTDDAFTLAPQPIALPSEVGETSLPGYQAAVSRAGVVYISLDVSAIQHPRTFHAQALGYPLRFTQHDVVFYNTQGFLMQLLGEGMPGLFAINAAGGSPDSDTLQYSRHEFHTFFLQHDERQTHGVDPSDPNWHSDGTPHIDHDHLIVAISGMLDDGSLPVSGATPAMELVMSSHSFFQHGLLGQTSVTFSQQASIDSYNSRTNSYGAKGHVRSNGAITATGNALVDGDATGLTVNIETNGIITGAVVETTETLALLPVEVPTAAENLGSIVLGRFDTLTLSPGSYQVAELSLYGGDLLIDNATGPVTLYVTGPVNVKSDATITTTDPNPEKFALYVASSDKVEMSANSSLYGVLYAPESLVKLSGRGEFFGAFVGQEVTVYGQFDVHYDPALHGE